jgi:anti-sigma regulatory factor (Ser/Thr protein kinase)
MGTGPTELLAAPLYEWKAPDGLGPEAILIEGASIDWVPNQFATPAERTYRTNPVNRTGGRPATNSSSPVFESFRAHPSALYKIRSFVRDRAGDSSLPAQMMDDLALAVSEACANSIIHTTSPDIRVTWIVSDDCVAVEILDRGIFKRQVRMPEITGHGSHGIALMMALVDELTIREGTPRRPGTLVRLVKCQPE